MKKALKYIITAAIGLAVALIIMFTHNVTGQESVKPVLTILSDAFFVPGVILAGVGLLVWVSAGGVFDMLAYGAIMFFDLFRKDLSNRKYKDFYEYRQAKKEKNRDFGFLLLVGLVFIAVSIVFIIVLYAI
ncbi:MAG: DUF3899 domain-containing protein [Candidatus Coproplasma sp.]